MSHSVIVTKDNELILGTWILSQHYKLPHVRLKKLVEKHQKDLAELGDSSAITKEYVLHLKGIDRPTAPRGRPIEEYMINGKQALYLLMLFKSMSDPKRIIKAMDNEELKGLFKDLIKK